MSISVELLCEIHYLFPEKPCQNVGLVEILVAKLGMVCTFVVNIPHLPHQNFQHRPIEIILNLVPRLADSGFLIARSIQGEKWGLRTYLSVKIWDILLEMYRMRLKVAEFLNFQNSKLPKLKIVDYQN